MSYAGLRFYLRYLAWEIVLQSFMNVVLALKLLC